MWHALNQSSDTEQQMLLQSLFKTLSGNDSVDGVSHNGQTSPPQLAEHRFMLPGLGPNTGGGSNPVPAVTGSYNQGSSNDNVPPLSLDQQSGYSTALSVTIIVGCSLLALNILVFAGVFLNRDATSGSSRSQNTNNQTTSQNLPVQNDNASNKQCYAPTPASGMYLPCNGCNDIQNGLTNTGTNLGTNGSGGSCAATILTLKQHRDGKTYVANASTGSPGKGNDRLLTQFAYATMLPIQPSHPLPQHQQQYLQQSYTQKSILPGHNQSQPQAQQTQSSQIYLPMDNVQLEISSNGEALEQRSTCELLQCDSMQCDCGCSSPFACPAASTNHCLNGNESSRPYVN